MHKRQHQYIERDTGQVYTEMLYSDGFMQFLYSEAVREKAAWLFRLLTGHRLSSQLLALLSFDLPFGAKRFGIVRFLLAHRINLHECVDPNITKKTARAIFERQIRYWECRPMPQTPGTVVSPADARLLLGSLQHQSHLFIKGKFFAYEELLGVHQHRWLQAFVGGDVAICRLTPAKYHYNHCPVSGIVRDIYELPGAYHSCHPAATVALATPLSKNRRVVTIIDTDVAYGSGVGLVAMIEVVALMVGNITQCYSDVRYAHPQLITAGMFLKIGQPKSVFRPGSSTVVLLFQAGRVQFAQGLLRHQTCPGMSVLMSAVFLCLAIRLCPLPGVTQDVAALKVSAISLRHKEHTSPYPRHTLKTLHHNQIARPGQQSGTDVGPGVARGASPPGGDGCTHQCYLKRRGARRDVLPAV